MVRVLHVRPPHSRQGDTLVGVVSELSRCELVDGATVGAVVIDNQDIHLAGFDNLAVDWSAHSPHQPLTRIERLQDALAGRLRRR
jgi:hypothetical protein